MEIATNTNSVSLRKDVSKALIDGSVFKHGPNQVIWALAPDPPPATANPTPAEVLSRWAAANPVKIESTTEANLLARFGPKPDFTPSPIAAHLAALAPSLPLSVIKLPQAGELHPVGVPEEGSKDVERLLLDIAKDAQPLADLCKLIPGGEQVPDAVACLLAGAEIVYELVHPKDQDRVRAVLFYAEESTNLVAAVVGSIPELDKVKLTLDVAVALIKDGDEVRMGFRPTTKPAQVTPG